MGHCPPHPHPTPTPPRSSGISGISGLGRSHRKSEEKGCWQGAGGGFYYCGWRSRLPRRPTTKMQARRARCCSGPAPTRETLESQKEGCVLPSLQMGWTGREVLAGGDQGDHPPPTPVPGAGGPALPYLGGGVGGGDGRVPRRAGRRLRLKAAAAGLGLGRRRAPRLRLLRAPLLRGAPGTHGSSAVLPRPAARLHLPPNGRNVEKSEKPCARGVPRTPSAPAVLLRTHPDCE